MMAPPAVADLICSSQQVFGFVYARNSRVILECTCSWNRCEKKMEKGAWKMYLNGCSFMLPVLAIPGNCPACSLCCRGVVPLGPELVLLMQPLKLEGKCQLLHAGPEATMWKGSSSSSCPSTRENSPHQSGLLLLMHPSGKPDKYEHHLNQANREVQALYRPPSVFSSPIYFFVGSSLLKAF